MTAVHPRTHEIGGRNLQRNGKAVALATGLAAWLAIGLTTSTAVAVDRANATS